MPKQTPCDPQGHSLDSLDLLLPVDVLGKRIQVDIQYREGGKLAVAAPIDPDSIFPEVYHDDGSEIKDGLTTPEDHERNSFDDRLAYVEERLYELEAVSLGPTFDKAPQQPITYAVWLLELKHDILQQAQGNKRQSSTEETGKVLNMDASGVIKKVRKAARKVSMVIKMDATIHPKQTSSGSR
jgi:hypothetical protein